MLAFSPSSILMEQSVMKKDINFIASSTCRMHASNICSCHAEANLLNKISNSAKYKTTNDKKNKKKYDMVIYRKNATGNYVNSKPCLSCAHLIKNSNCINNVFYVNEFGIFEKVKANRITDNAILLRKQIDNNNMIIKHLYSKRSKYI
jgi:deoxycytidylate deaminase